MEIPYNSKPRPDTGLYNAKVGIWLFLASEVMLFGALFSSYIMLRVGAPEGTWPAPGSLLKVGPGAFNTVVLILSSVTVVLAWASLKFNNFKQYRMFQGITIVCALIFMCVKAYEYHDKFTHYEIVLKEGVTHYEGISHGTGVRSHLNLVDGHLVNQTEDEITLTVHPHHDDHAGHDHGAEAHPEEHDGDHYGHDHAEHAHGGHDAIQVTVRKSDIAKMESYGPWHSTYLAIYFTMTGLHAIHVIGGAFVIFYIWGPGAKMWKTDPERYVNRVEVSGLFWHLVDLVWIFLFPILYLL